MQLHRYNSRAIIQLHRYNSRAIIQLQRYNSRTIIQLHRYNSRAMITESESEYLLSQRKFARKFVLRCRSLALKGLSALSAYRGNHNLHWRHAFSGRKAIRCVCEWNTDCMYDWNTGCMYDWNTLRVQLSVHDWKTHKNWVRLNWAHFVLWSKHNV